MHKEYPDFLIPGMILTAVRSSRLEIEYQIMICSITGISVMMMVFLEGAGIAVDKKKLMAFLVIFTAVVMMHFNFYNNKIMEMI